MGASLQETQGDTERARFNAGPSGGTLAAASVTRGENRIRGAEARCLPVHRLLGNFESRPDRSDSRTFFWERSFVKSVLRLKMFPTRNGKEPLPRYGRRYEGNRLALKATFRIV